MTEVRINSIEIKNYKLCKNAKVVLNGNLTALLGINGAGKTTILQGIELLHSATDRSPDSTPFFSDIRRKEYDITTVIVEIYWHGRQYEFELEAYFQKDMITASPKTSTYSLVDVKAKKKYKYQDINFVLAYSQMKYRSSIEGLIADSKRPTEEEKSVYRDMVDILAYVHNIVYIETSDFLGSSQNNTTIEVSSRYGYGVNRYHRENIDFLKSLYKLKSSDAAKFKRYKKIVSRVGGGLVDDIEFEPLTLPKSSVQLYKNGKLSTTEEVRELIVPIFTIGTNKLYNNQLSEGTFRALALIYYILNSDASMVILEEPELSVHYDLLADLIGLIEDSAVETQTVISTHSERIINLIDYKDIIIVSRNERGVSAKSLVGSLSKSSKEVLLDYLHDGGGLSNFISSDL